MGDQGIAVVTTSFCKAKYLTQLKEALAFQTNRRFSWYVLDNSIDPETRFLVQSWREDWITVRLYDFTDEERSEHCPHPVLLNQIIHELEEQYFCHISDDDLPDPRYIDTMAGFLRYNRDKAACYVPARYVIQNDDGSFSELHTTPSAPIVFGSRVDPLSHLDGNSVMFSLEQLRDLGQPWPESWDEAETCDGQMLRSWCEKERIWPATSEPLLIHRVTELSAWRNSKHGYLHGSKAFIPASL